MIDREYRITDINNTALQTMGLTRDEAVGRHCYEVSHRLSEPCHSHGEECGLQHVFETGEACNLHHEHFDADGNRFYADILTSPLRDEDGNITHVIETVRDVTDLFEAQRKVMESEERFRTVVEQSPVAIEIYEPNGRLLSVNDAWAKFWDLEKEAVADFNILDDPECERTRLTSAFKEAQQGITQILSDVHYDAEKSGLTGGRKRWISPKMYPILDQEKKVKHIVLTYDDITERKQAEEERKILQIQLSQAQKMEAIGTLAGGIAHNFNNLLMGIQGRTSLMMLETDRFHPSFEHLQEIEICIQKAAKLTKQLLGFARGGKYEIKPTDLNDLVENCAQMFGRTKKEITYFKKYEEKLWPAAVDQSQIDQVLLNIFVNAWQAMPEGGDLYIQTKNEILDDNFVRAYGVAPGKYIKISIMDTGIGMDEKTMKRVFDPFFTTKEKGRGTGFGLASAYGIIKNHDGIINVESAKDEGATFNVYLPASEKTVIREEAYEQKISVGSETILLVDDEAMIIDVSVQMLNKMGYKVLTAHNGREAIDIFKQNYDKVGIVILDMIMPGMGGGEVYERLKEIDTNVKVLLSSGYSINGQAAEILNRGCDGFIQKPFKLNELSYKLREIISKQKVKG